MDDAQEYAKRARATPGYDSTVQSRGIYVWRANSSPKWVDLNVDISYRFFFCDEEWTVDARTFSDLFSIRRILRDSEGDDMEAARLLYHRPIHARGLSASLAASVLKLSELAEGQERPDRSRSEEASPASHRTDKCGRPRTAALRSRPRLEFDHPHPHRGNPRRRQSRPCTI